MNRARVSFEMATEYWSLREDQLYPFDENVIASNPCCEDEILAKKELFSKTQIRLNTITLDEVNNCKQTLLKCIDSILKSMKDSRINMGIRSSFYNRIAHSINSATRLG